VSRPPLSWFSLALAALVLLYAMILLPGRWLDLGIWLYILLAFPLLAWGLFPVKLSAFASHGWGKVIKIVVWIGYGLVLSSAAIIIGMLIRNARMEPAKNADVVLILGAGLWGSEPSPALAQRLDTGLAYAQENPDCLVVVSGGQGLDEPCAEASVMAQYLLDRGLAQDRLLAEDKSISTLENFRFSKLLLDERLGTDYSLVFVTTDFHIFRAKLTARHCGLPQAQGLAAPANRLFAPIYYSREYLAMVKTLIFGIDGLQGLSEIF